MKLSIFTIEGSTDGLRFGCGRAGRESFSYSYDLLNDIFRLWRMNSDTGWNRAEIIDPETAAQSRAIVRRRLGLAGKAA